MTLSTPLLHCLLSPSSLHLPICRISGLELPPKSSCLSSTPVLHKSLPRNQLGQLPTCKTQAVFIQTPAVAIYEAFPTASLCSGTGLSSPKSAPGESKSPFCGLTLPLCGASLLPFPHTFTYRGQ